MRRLVTSAVLTAVFAIPSFSYSATTEVAGVPNFHKVNDRVYRGGQPDSRGWTELARIGVKKVVDLRQRTEHSTTAESLAVTSAGMRYVNAAMDGWATPTSEQIKTPLALLDDEEPVFVHCKRGRERTGSVIAAYRISREGWTNEKALEEAREKGMAWWAKGMRRFIAAYRPAPDAEPLTEPLADMPMTEADSVGVAATR